MELQPIIFNVRELCDKGAWYGRIGTQSRDTPYAWTGFVFPALQEVSIDSINMTGDMFRRINDETLFTNADMTLSIGGIEHTFDIPQAEVDLEGNIDNYISVHSHTFFGLEKEEVEQRFVMEVMRLLKGDWGGNNNVLASDALKNYLLTSKDTKYFSDRYPELLI